MTDQWTNNQSRHWLVNGWKTGQEMLTDLRLINQSRDVDWSKDNKPVNFGDDAEGNYCWELVASPPVYGWWKWPSNMGKFWPSHFSLDWIITISNVSAWRYFITIKGLDNKIKMLSFKTIPYYYSPTNYICTASGRLDRGMDSGLCKGSPDLINAEHEQTQLRCNNKLRYNNKDINKRSNR